MTRHAPSIRSARCLVPCLAALGLLPAVSAEPAAAAEFVPGWDTEFVWDSNIFRQDPDQQLIAPVFLDGNFVGRRLIDAPEEESGFSLRAGPNLKLRENQGDLQYQVNYRLRYEHFFTVDVEQQKPTDLGDYDHFADVLGTWRVSRSTDVSLSDYFVRSKNLAALIDFVQPGIGAGFDPTANVLGNQQLITTNNANASITHRLSPRWQLQSQFQSQLYEYDDETVSDTSSLGGYLELTYGLSQRAIVGGGVQILNQEFDLGRTTRFYQGFGVLSYRFSPTVVLFARAGPAWSQPESIDTGGDVPLGSFLAVNPGSCPTDADGAPVFLPQPQSESDLCTDPAQFFRRVETPFGPVIVPTGRIATPGSTTDVPSDLDQQAAGSLTYFARISLAKRWETWDASVEYERSASNSSGLGTSATLDAFTLNVGWTPTRKWQLDFRAAYTTQTAANDTFQTQIVLDQACVFDDDPTPQPCRPLAPGEEGAVVGVPTLITQGDEIGDPIEIRTYRVDLRARHSLTDNLVVDARASYQHQKTQGGGLAQFIPGLGFVLDDGRTVNVLRFGVGITWTFDPIIL
jgi:hypothetical protein